VTKCKYHQTNRPVSKTEGAIYLVIVLLVLLAFIYQLVTT
jgi:hypothetical protein